MQNKTEQQAGAQAERTLGSQARICIVAQVIPPQFGGAGLRAYRYASRLHKAGRLARIITERTVPQDTLQNSLAVELDIPEEKISRVPRRPFKGRQRASKMKGREISFFFQSFVLVSALVVLLLRKRREYDVIFCFGASQLPQYAALVGAFLGKEVVISSTMLGVDDPWALRNEWRGVRRMLHAIVLSRASAFISISRPITDACEKAMMPKEKVWEIPNPVDANVFGPCGGDERKRLRDELGIPRDSLALLSVGGVIERKGVDLTVEAIGRLKDLSPSAELFVVGPHLSNTEADGRFVSRLRRRISELGLDDRVKFVGVAGNVHEWMKACDVFVFPSRSEGFGTVLVEAMASGLPVITGELGGIGRWVITDGEDGYIVDYNADAVAAAIRRLSVDEDARKHISQNAVQTVQARFSVGVVDAQYDRIYSAVLGDDRCAAGRSGRS